ncbi:SUMF1/EgtB/PvdO family nonheme iron enzyme, partial [bacterium]|nr:SUMF1/EgtB/PvdO family nonheme iron enzyme [bacterium]
MLLLKRAFLAVFILCLLFVVSCSSDDDNNDEQQQTFTPDGMKLIPAGGQSLQMGSESGFDNEQPVHTVSFTNDFWMDSTEITQQEYDNLMSAHYGDYTTPIWNNPYGAGDGYPAYQLYWGDAVLFCNARSAVEGFDSVYTYSSING